jgi:ATP-binding cassette, subfamily F, member 3
VGELPPMAGDRMAHPDLRIGYFAQHTVESLHEGQSPMDHFRDLSPDGSNQSFRDFLGKWNFPGDRAFEPVDGFSGGERARLALALIAWQQPNVLLLDEPTNHLDLEMREALAEALSDFDGAIVMVSHDRHLIGLVCDTFWRVADGVVEPFAGDLDEYAAWLRTRASAQGSKPLRAEPAPAPKTAPTPARKVNPVKLAAAEAKVAELEGKLADVDAQLADPNSYADADLAARLGRDREALQQQLAKAEEAWSALYDEA